MPGLTRTCARTQTFRWLDVALQHACPEPIATGARQVGRGQAGIQAMACNHNRHVTVRMGESRGAAQAFVLQAQADSGEAFDGWLLADHSKSNTLPHGFGTWGHGCGAAADHLQGLGLQTRRIQPGARVHSRMRTVTARPRSTLPLRSWQACRHHCWPVPWAQSPCHSAAAEECCQARQSCHRLANAHTGAQHCCSISCAQQPTLLLLEAAPVSAMCVRADCLQMRGVLASLQPIIHDLRNLQQTSTQAARPCGARRLLCHPRDDVSHMPWPSCTERAGACLVSSQPLRVLLGLLEHVLARLAARRRLRSFPGLQHCSSSSAAHHVGV